MNNDVLEVNERNNSRISSIILALYAGSFFTLFVLLFNKINTNTQNASFPFEEIGIFTIRTGNRRGVDRGAFGAVASRRN